MEIAVLGAGKMSALLGGYWARSGHRIYVGSRDPARARNVASQIGGRSRSGRYDEAIEAASIVLLAVTPDTAVGIARDNAAALDGKIVIDCNTRHYPAGRGTYPIPSAPSLAEAIAAAAPGARVAKAFASIGTGVLGYVLQKNRSVVDGKRTSVFYCASDVAAGQCTRGLIEELHLDAVDCGDLGQAYYLETLGALSMWLADNRYGENFAINLIRDRKKEASPLDRFM
ncbi:MAG: NAD(P)-binding domain-containing protein [Vulcanimicrobiaceae bacterium]